MRKPVVVCGASGYTAKLIIEFLRSFQVPFIAAGRNRDRVEAAMKLIPGIETADYEIAELPTDVADLKKLFAGSKVVCNTVGPFVQHSEPTIQAALEAGCHYLDTTNEQNYMLPMRDKYGAEFARKQLLLAPSTAHMCTIMETAAEACLAESEVDTIEGVCIVSGTPTPGSTQTFIQSVTAEERYLEGGVLQLWRPCHSAEVRVPFTDRTLLALPWGGSGLPLWYQDDPRVQSVRTMAAFTNRDLMEGVLKIYSHYHANLKQLPEDGQREALAQIAAGMQPGAPPRENPMIHRNWDTIIGSSTTKTVRYTIYSHCGYQITGLLQAFAANWLSERPPRAVGFQGAAHAFGYERILGVLEKFGYGKLVRGN
jgi:hypothetical protein